MAAVNITKVQVHDNPSPFLAPFRFEIEYECLSPLNDDLEWKMLYVGSAESDKYDQVLDSALVGPVLPGNFRFVFEANAPDPSKIPSDDMTGVTVVLLTCSYKEKEFVRVGYYVNVDYQDEALKENPPEVPLIQSLWRHILEDHPRVTRFPIPFDDEPTEVPGEVAMEGEGMLDGAAGGIMGNGLTLPLGGQQVGMDMDGLDAMQ